MYRLHVCIAPCPGVEYCIVNLAFHSGERNDIIMHQYSILLGHTPEFNRIIVYDVLMSFKAKILLTIISETKL